MVMVMGDGLFVLCALCALRLLSAIRYPLHIRYPAISGGINYISDTGYR